MNSSVVVSMPPKLRGGCVSVPFERTLIRGGSAAPAVEYDVREQEPD
jgi:hypothetical protein